MEIHRKKYPHYKIEVRISGKDIIAMIFAVGALTLRGLGINTLVDFVILTILISYFGFEAVKKARK